MNKNATFKLKNSEMIKTCIICEISITDRDIYDLRLQNGSFEHNFVQLMI